MIIDTGGRDRAGRAAGAAGAHTRVYAVVVAFQPSIDALGGLLFALAPQVEQVLVVDNTPGDNREARAWLARLSLPNALYVELGENKGIATALNVGIRMAMEAGATHVLLSDQDSLPDAGMVGALLHSMRRLQMGGARVGAVGPCFVDRNTGIAHPFQARVPGKFFYGHRCPTPPEGTVEALTLITSGTLIPIAVLDDVGGMREDFFIDHVDIEWCHRARARGWRLFGTAAATMRHSMGDEDALRVWYFGWRRESSYSPLRMYYRIRNFVALCQLDYIGWRWKVRNAWYWLGFVYSHVLFGRTRLASLGMAGRGVLDGLRGRMGPCKSVDALR